MIGALIVVESYFDNTRAIVEVVAIRLTEGDIEAQVIDVTRAPSALPSDLDLLALGVPTHNRRLPTTITRVKAREQATSEEASPGIGEWLETVAIPTSTDAAAFDMVISKGWLSGSVAKAITKMLQRRQGRQTALVRSFAVTASKGPLASGQEAGAHSWGREFAASTNTR